MPKHKLVTMKYILGRIASVRIGVKNAKNANGYRTDVNSVHCRRQAYSGYWNPDTLASLALITLLAMSYSMLPFVSSSSSTYYSEHFNDELENGTTDVFISHMSRSQLGYSASRVTNPTEISSSGQNDFSDAGGYNVHRTSPYQKKERYGRTTRRCFINKNVGNVFHAFCSLNKFFQQIPKGVSRKDI